MDNMLCFKRIIAFVIDWNLCGIPCMIFSAVFKKDFLRPSFDNVGLILIFGLLVVLYPVFFLLKDFVLRGRSIGKRIFKLYVINKMTNEPANSNSLILRNVFFFLAPISAILLLATKESIGDRITNTTVICK